MFQVSCPAVCRYNHRPDLLMFECDSPTIVEAPLRVSNMSRSFQHAQRTAERLAGVDVPNKCLLKRTETVIIWFPNLLGIRCQQNIGLCSAQSQTHRGHLFHHCHDPGHSLTEHTSGDGAHSACREALPWKGCSDYRRHDLCLSSKLPL